MIDDIYKERFLKKIKVGLREDDCWEWLAYKNKGGYGVFGTEKRKIELAHRVAYKIFIGEIPDGLYVLHKCDNPGCQSPKHLWVGTQKDNAMDRENKHRSNHPVGENHHWSGKDHSGKYNGKLGTHWSKEWKEQQGRRMAGRYCGENNPNYGNHKLVGKNNPMYGVHRFGENAPNSRLTTSDVQEIRLLLCKGELSLKEIARIFKVSATHIGYIKKNKSRRAG